MNVARLDPCEFKIVFLRVYVAFFYLRNVFHRDSFVLCLVCFIFFD